MTACRLPIVVIVCLSTLVVPARPGRAGAIEVAVQAAKSPPAKWFAKIAAGYLLGKGADWGWDQITGKPKVDALDRKITETEASYPAYKVYFEALRVNINSNTDQRTFEHSIADIVRKIDEDAAAANRLKNTPAPAPAFPTGSPLPSFSAADFGLSGVRPGSLSTGLVGARLLPPSEAATALLGKTAVLPLSNPIVSPYGAESWRPPTNPWSSPWGAGAMVLPPNSLHSPYGVGSTLAPANLGAPGFTLDLPVQPSNPVSPSSGLSDPTALANPLYSPYGSGTPVTPWRRYGYAPLGIDPTATPALPGSTLPGSAAAPTPANPADPQPQTGGSPIPWDPRYYRPRDPR